MWSRTYATVLLHAAALLFTGCDVWRPVLGSALPVQLVRANFSSFVETVPDTDGVLMEFYASWCPACQRFQPIYEQVSGFFNAEPKVQPEVVVARVDCATQSDVCNDYDVGHYPTLKYGLPSTFNAEGKHKLVEYKMEKTAARIIEWVGDQKGVRYDFDPNKPRQDARHSSTAVGVATESGVPLNLSLEADAQDLEKATHLAFKYALEAQELLKGAESRQAFSDFAGLVAAAHPIQRCSESAQKMLAALPELWPASQTAGPDARLQAIHVCGSEAAELDWRACKGSKENKRGYTCGLWLLFHSLAGRVEPPEAGGAVWMTAVRGYVKHFFQCSDCARHFTEMAAEKAALEVGTRRQAVLWAWRAHNEVNRRLEAMEKSSGDGDPAFPKVQWPPTEVCPLCRLRSLASKVDVTWNEDEIYRFLLKYYHGAAAGEWLPKATNSLGHSWGGRRNLETRAPKGSRRRHLLALLGVAIVLGAVGLAARRRTRPSRKMVSL